jgi:hypothetical protein
MPKAKQRMAVELLMSRNTDSPWPEILRNTGISERTARLWASMEMTPTAQHERHGHAGGPGKLTNNEKEEILARARQQRAKHGVVDTSWTRAMMAEVTDDRIPSATDSSISRFRKRAEWPIRRVQTTSNPELRSPKTQHPQGLITSTAY